MTLIKHRSNGRHKADISIPRHLANAVPNTTPLRALLVDDNDHFIQTVRDHLECDGINIVGVATTPAEALRQTTYAATDFAEILDASPRRHCHFWVI